MRFYVSSKKKVTASRSSNPLDQASAGCRPGLRPPYLANSAVFRVVGHGRFESCYQRAAGERRCTAAGVKQRVMSRLFISHSSSNNAEAVALGEWLRGQGWDDVFLDLDPERGLKAGGRWQAALKQAAERCELVIFLISPEWAGSKWCLAEFLLAKNLNKRIFGVVVQPTPFKDLPTEMTAEWQLVDLTEGKRDYRSSVAPPPGDTDRHCRVCQARSRPSAHRPDAGRPRRSLFRLASRGRSRPRALSRARSRSKPRMPASSSAVTVPRSSGSTCCGGSRAPHPDFS